MHGSLPLTMLVVLFFLILGAFQVIKKNTFKLGEEEKTKKSAAPYLLFAEPQYKFWIDTVRWM